METTAHRHSSDRFLDEFNEDDLLFTTEPEGRPSPPRHQHHARRASFPHHPGIRSQSPVLYRIPVPRQSSAPVNIPILSRAVMTGTEIEEEMLPPHEMVARASPNTTYSDSVLEGLGRTLKGRDLRQVRNAIWRQTGFLD